jgi:hypothetical protein
MAKEKNPHRDGGRAGKTNRKPKAEPPVDEYLENILSHPKFTATGSETFPRTVKLRKFVPPTNPPDFAVEQAALVLARRIVRAAWARNRDSETVTEASLSWGRAEVQMIIDRAVKRLVGS